MQAAHGLNDPSIRTTLQFKHNFLDLQKHKGSSHNLETQNPISI